MFINICAFLVILTTGGAEHRRVNDQVHLNVALLLLPFLPLLFLVALKPLNRKHRKATGTNAGDVPLLPPPTKARANKKEVETQQRRQDG